MTNMNPLRDDGLAAQERVAQLEKELAEKDKLIYKLQNPQKEKKAKPPRQPINWPTWFRKAAKISAATIGGTALILSCICLFECNATYVTKGKITKVTNTMHTYKDACHLVPNKKGRLYRPEYCERKIGDTSYGIEVEFQFQGKKKVINFYPFEELSGKTWPETAEKPPLPDISHAVYFGSAIPKVGCIVEVYYPLGDVFNDRTFFRPFIVDASQCGP